MIYKVLCGDTDITEYVTSLKSSIQFENNTPLIGNAPSQTFNIQIDNSSRVMENILDKVFRVYQDDELVATLEVLEMPEQVFETLDLTLYDNLVKTNTPYNTNTQMYPCKVIDQLQEMSSMLHINIDYSLLPSNILNKEVNSYDTTQNIRIYLCWIAEMSCSNVFCNPDGSIIFRPVTKEIAHEIKNDDYVYSFTKANKCDFTMVVDELHNFYCGDEQGNVLRTTQNNPYINAQSDIDYIFSQIGRITFDSVQQLKMRAVHGLELGEIVHYKDYLTVFPIKIEKTYYNGEMAHDVITVDGNVNLSLKSSYIGDQNYSAKIRRLMINVDENNQKLQIVSTEQDELQKNIGDLQISFDTIKLSVEQEITNSIYKMETGKGNIFDNCNQIVSKKEDELEEKFSTNMPLGIDKSYMRDKDICISVNVRVEDGVITEKLGNYIGAEFTIRYADGEEKLYNTRWHMGQYDLQYLLQTSTVDVNQRIYAHFKVENKEILSVSNLKITINLNAKNAVVSYPKVEFGVVPTGIEFDIPNFRDNITSLTTNFTEINQTVGELSLKAVRMDKEITTIKGNVSDVTTRLQSAEIKVQPTNILLAVNEKMGIDGQLYTTKFVLDKNGVHISGGGLDIKNNAGTKVFYADGNGNLVINNLTATNGKFTGSISGSSITGSTITGGSITSNTTINVNTDLTIGNNVYIGSYSNRDTKKYIYFNDLFFISSRNSIISMGVNNGNLYDGKFYVTSSGSCTVNGTSVNIIASNSILIQGSSIAINGGHLNAQSGAIYNNYFALQNNEWIGFYNGGGISGKRKGWIGHDGTNVLRITNEAGSTVYINCDMQIPNGSKLWSKNTSGSSTYLAVMGTNNVAYFGDNSYQNCLRGTKVYLGSSGATVTSDRNLKYDIEPIKDKYVELFKKLKPINYKYINGGAKRPHIGFIAQDIEDSLKEIGMTSNDFAGLCIDEASSDGDEDSGWDGNYLVKNGFSKMYTLVYEEFIALNTHMIQNNILNIKNLEQRISALEKELIRFKELI